MIKLGIPFGVDLTRTGYRVEVDGCLYTVTNSLRKNVKSGSDVLVLTLEKPKLSIVNCCASCCHMDHGFCENRNEIIERYNWCPSYKRRKGIFE